LFLGEVAQRLYRKEAVPQGKPEKTEAAHISKMQFPGYGFYRCKGEGSFRTSPKSVKKMKGRIRQPVSRGNGWGNEFSAMKPA
jgi:hypothetical protein